MASAAKPVPAPSPDEVRAISSIPDPVLRNLRITECYYRLSQSFTAWTGSCANWCTFATWASRQAGYTIRAEDMLHALNSRLRTGSALLHPVEAFWRFVIRRGAFYPDTVLGRLVREIHSPLDAFEAASDAVARGNLKVFEEVGAVFARFMHTPREDWDRFLASLSPGEPPAGQDLLRRAFTLYREQSLEPDPAVRTQMILLANVLIGLHEQTRLQPEIREAMEAGLRTVANRSLILRILRPLARGLAGLAREAAREAITSSLMVLRFPETTLQLGRHLDRLCAPGLDHLDLPELQSLVSRYDAADCGAVDWSDLNQRMRYIARLFRCFHGDRALLGPPFTNEQCAEIAAGSVPFGSL